MQQWIDGLIRKRALWATGLGMGLLATLPLAIAAPEQPDGAAVIQQVAWLLWIGLVTVFLLTSGAWWRAAAVRSIMNDESTRRHLQRGFSTGFWVFLLCSLLAFGATYLAPISAREVLRIVTSAAIAAAALRFGALEREALRHG